MQFVLILNCLQYVNNISLQHHPCHYYLVEYIHDLIAVENQIEFADIFKAFVKCFDEHLD